MTEKKLKNLDDLFVDVLEDMYDAEHQIVKALPKMAESASSKELKDGFKEHLEMTRQQIKRLDEVFADLKMKPKGKHCKGMEGLLKEGDEILEEPMTPPVRDAALIAAAQKVEHYEISGYGTLRTFAQTLGRKNIVRLLDETAKEESATDKKLTALAEGHINTQAIKGDSKSK